MDQEVNIIRIENWKRLILEANNSGLSKTEWCRQNNISSKTFFYWQSVGQRIEGDANDKLFFRPLKNRPRSLGANGRLTAIIRHIIGEY